MTRGTPISLLTGAVVIPLTALAVAGCGDGSTSATGATSTTAPAATVRVANSSLGRILVDSRGRTLYLFKKDTRTKSRCTRACAAAWHPVPANGKPTAGSGVSAAKLGTTTRSDGSSQVTYSGHPLYRFVMDNKPGDVSGEGLMSFGAAWLVVPPGRADE